MELLTPVDALKKAVELAGGRRLFAENLTTYRLRFLPHKDAEVSLAQVWNWIHRDGGAPAIYCPDIEELFGVKCEELQPDVNWAVLRKTPRKARAVA